MNTDDPAQLREFAADAARGAVAMIEAKSIRAYDAANPAAEEMRMTRLLAGTAPTVFRVERGQMPSSASCDDLFEPGQSKFVLLYPTQTAAEGARVYRVSSLCTNLLLTKPVFRDAVRAELARGERG
jgi:hypothetical protein